MNDNCKKYNSLTLTADEIKQVKGLGCLQDKRYTDVFNVRILTRNGKITNKELTTIADAAKQFGDGCVTMTTRLTIEVQGVHYSDINPLISYLKEHDLQTGGTGAKVRPVVSCKGTTCQYGLIDTFSLSEKIHEKFYVGYHDISLPHKFKIAVGGCPNNCAKPDLNDVGIIGQRVVKIDFDKCRGCGKCQIAINCPVKAATVKDGKVYIDTENCNRCGRCLNKCPFKAFNEHTDGYKIYLGGRWGKKIARGIPVNHLFTSEEEVLDFIEKTILFFKDNGENGERFADTVNRIGFENVEKALLNK